MSLYTRFASGLLFPLHERLKRHSSVRVRRELEKTQWWSAAQLRELQLQRLRELIQRVFEQVPYYRDQLSELDLRADDFQSLHDLRKLPLLSKADIRANQEALKARDATGLTRMNTGGSSGEPLVFHVGRERFSHDIAAKWRATRWWGVDIGDPEAVIWGSPVELGAQDKVRAIRDRLLRSRLIPAFEMSPENLDRFVDEIRRIRPKMLFGYPSSLTLIGEHAQARGIDMTELGIEVAFVTAERLYDHQREKLGRIFGCRVANGYGGRDAGFIAHECPEGGMHLTAEDIIVELIRPDGSAAQPGEEGEVVVTELFTWEYPFIRYRTGDVAVMSEEACACGRGLPLLKEIQGRTTDFIVAPDGTVMHGLALIYILRDLPGVANFRITQETRSQISVEVVRDAAWKDDAEPAIREGFSDRLGPGIELDIRYVDDIERTGAGKFRYVVSKLDQYQQG